MRKKILIVFISLLSMLVISYLLWIIILSNPNLSYSHETKFNQVTIYHNQALDKQAETIITDALEIIKKSELYDKERKIKLCLNDDKIYPKLFPIETYAFTLNNTSILKMGEYKFDENLVELYWNEKDVYQEIDLTWLLAHEFTHNLQFGANEDYVKNTTKRELNWKLEGHADYIARNFKNDGKLKEKISEFLIKHKKGDDWIEVNLDKEGKKQVQQYYNYYNKYSLLIQYLLEEKGMNYHEICNLETDIDKIYNEMIEWRNK